MPNGFLSFFFWFIQKTAKLGKFCFQRTKNRFHLIRTQWKTLLLKRESGYSSKEKILLAVKTSRIRFGEAEKLEQNCCFYVGAGRASVSRTRVPPPRLTKSNVCAKQVALSRVCVKGTKFHTAFSTYTIVSIQIKSIKSITKLHNSASSFAGLQPEAQFVEEEEENHLHLLSDSGAIDGAIDIFIN